MRRYAGDKLVYTDEKEQPKQVAQTQETEAPKKRTPRTSKKED